jgi:hypothetical protein
MKYPFYQLFSGWMYILFILYLIGIVKFSILPTIIVTFIGSIIFILASYIYSSKNNKPNIYVVIFILITHAIPLFIVKYDLSNKILLYNFIIFLLYNLSLLLQNTNIIEVYMKLLKNHGISVGVLQYYKDLGIIP